MTENKRFKIVDEQFISYYGGTGHKISNEECGFWLWHSKNESQKVCDKLNSILDENEQLKQEYQKLEYRHSLLHDDIVDAECERDSLKKDVESLEKENEQLAKEKERYKRLSEIRREEINNRILTIKEFINNCSDNKVRSVLKELFYSEVNEYDLSSENRKLLNENEQLKQQLKELQEFKDNYDKNMELIHNSEYVQDFLFGNL